VEEEVAAEVVEEKVVAVGQEKATARTAGAKVMVPVPYRRTKRVKFERGSARRSSRADGLQPPISRDRRPCGRLEYLRQAQEKVGFDSLSRPHLCHRR